MVRVAQISVLAKVAGNVNADEVIGQRITLKKFYTSEGEVKPFISARAVKYAIRQALKTQGFEVDPFQLERGRLFDSGNPLKYIDNDIFGFMVAQRDLEGLLYRVLPQHGEIGLHTLPHDVKSVAQVQAQHVQDPGALVVGDGVKVIRWVRR